MAFLRPESLKALTLTYNGPVDNITDVPIGWNRGSDMRIFYVDLIVHDANVTFDTTLITLEWDDGASGADTAIEAFQTGAVSAAFAVGSDQDALTSYDVPAGSRFLLTADNVSTGADLGLTFVIWYVDGGQAAEAS